VTDIFGELVGRSGRFRDYPDARPPAVGVPERHAAEIAIGLHDITGALLLVVAMSSRSQERDSRVRTKMPALAMRPSCSGGTLRFVRLSGVPHWPRPTDCRLIDYLAIRLRIPKSSPPAEAALTHPASPCWSSATTTTTRARTFSIYKIMVNLPASVRQRSRVLGRRRPGVCASAISPGPCRGALRTRNVVLALEIDRRSWRGLLCTEVSAEPHRSAR